MDTLYARLIVSAALLAMIDPLSVWKHRLAASMARYPSVPLGSYGCASDWDTRPFWR